MVPASMKDSLQVSGPVFSILFTPTLTLSHTSVVSIVWCSAIIGSSRSGFLSLFIIKVLEDEVLVTAVAGLSPKPKLDKRRTNEAVNMTNGALLTRDYSSFHRSLEACDQRFDHEHQRAVERKTRRYFKTSR
jgi:hypothetical protein